MSAEFEAYEPLALTTRSGHVESVHHGALVALDRHGAVVFSVGDPFAPVYPRSSMKPLQAVSMVQHGLRLPPDLLALACASHDGRPEHLAGARRTLSLAALDESALANTADLPLDTATAHDVLRSGGGPSAIQMNCSGKHAAMLLTCVVNGWSTGVDYLDPDHPMQRSITDDLPPLVGAPASHIGIDGCGAPAHELSLIGLARAYATIATGAAGDAARDVHTAMTAHPEMVGGPGRDVTEMMRAVPGLMAKDGAEGVFAAAMPDGRAVALKVADGATRPRAAAMVLALRALGVDVGALDDAVWHLPILGHGHSVGEVSIVGSLARVARPD